MKIKSSIICNYCCDEEIFHHDSKENIDNILKEKGWIEENNNILCSNCVSIEENLDEEKLTVKRATVEYATYGCRDAEEYYCPTCHRKIASYLVNKVSKDIVRCPYCGQRLDKNSVY